MAACTLVGMTLEQAGLPSKNHLSSRFDRPEVAVDVFGYNSKVFYVVIQGRFRRPDLQLPVKGNETVLDALSQFVRSSAAAQSTRMWVARPGSNECSSNRGYSCPSIGFSITQRGNIATKALTASRR